MTAAAHNRHREEEHDHDTSERSRRAGDARGPTVAVPASGPASSRPRRRARADRARADQLPALHRRHHADAARRPGRAASAGRSEEHTSELQSRGHLVCRLLLEKKKTNKIHTMITDI